MKKGSYLLIIFLILGGLVLILGFRPREKKGEELFIQGQEALEERNYQAAYERFQGAQDLGYQEEDLEKILRVLDQCRLATELILAGDLEEAQEALLRAQAWNQDRQLDQEIEALLLELDQAPNR